ncbi:hypothetical protein ACOMHN_012628 [Nucella lapillus]
MSSPLSKGHPPDIPPRLTAHAPPAHDPTNSLRSQIMDSQFKQQSFLNDSRKSDDVASAQNATSGDCGTVHPAISDVKRVKNIMSDLDLM